MNRKQLVRRHYDTAPQYSRHRNMQGQSSTKLVNLIDLHLNALEGTVLDIGCGAGQLLSSLNSTTKASPSAHFVGIDLSYNQINAGRNDASAYIFAVGDALQLPFKNEAFSLVASNQVLHWIVSPDDPESLYQAALEMCRVTRTGGHIAISTAGLGSAPTLLRAYKSLVSRVYGRPERIPQSVQMDPIGSLRLDDVVAAFRHAGVRTISGELVYEPVDYPSCLNYLDDVRSWGGKILTGPFPHTIQQEAWSWLSQEFTRIVGSGQYTHEQYIIYYLGIKE